MAEFTSNQRYTVREDKDTLTGDMMVVIVDGTDMAVARVSQSEFAERYTEVFGN